MKKVITFFCLCLIVLILYPKLDAFFAIAVAHEKNCYSSQSAYKYSYGPEVGLSELQEAQAHIRQDLIETGIRGERSWDVFVRSSSDVTGDFTMAHGFFAIVKGIAVNASEPSVCISIIGVGVSRKDPLKAINNAIEDMNVMMRSINSKIEIGVFELKSSDLSNLYEFGRF